MSSSKKTPSATTAAVPDAESRLQETLRHVGAFVLVALAGSGLWLVTPAQPWGAIVGMGLLAGALLSPARSLGLAAVASGIAAGATASVLALRAGAPGDPLLPATPEIVLMFLVVSTVAFVVALSGQFGLKRVWVAYLLLAAISITLVVQSSAVAEQMGPGVDVEFADEQYAFDPMMFQKTYYLMEGGMDFYEAYGAAFERDARFDTPTRDLAGWRSPTTFWIWNLIAERWSTVMNVFIFLGVLSLFGAYFVVLRAFGDEVVGVVPAALLMPYYLFALQRWWFPELEFWATFAAFGSLVAVYARREKVALGFAFVAGAMREWLLSALIAGVAARLASSKPVRAWYWLVGAGVVVAGYLVNSEFVRRYLLSVGLQPQVGTGGRVGGGGPGFILYTARFCGDLMAHAYVVPWLVLALAAIVAVVMTVRARSLFLPALLFAPLAGFMIFGSGQGPLGETGWNDYYGAAYLPFAFILVAGLVDPIRLLVSPQTRPDLDPAEKTSTKPQKAASNNAPKSNHKSGKGADKSSRTRR